MLLLALLDVASNLTLRVDQRSVFTRSFLLENLYPQACGSQRREDWKRRNRRKAHQREVREKEKREREREVRERSERKREREREVREREGMVT